MKIVTHEPNINAIFCVEKKNNSHLSDNKIDAKLKEPKEKRTEKKNHNNNNNNHSICMRYRIVKYRF